MPSASVTSSTVPRNAATTSPAADLAVVRIRADESRQEVVQPRGLDLQPALVRTRVLGEDLEDHFGAVEHANLELELQVALLPRAQVVVADDKIECALELELAELIQLAHADEVTGIASSPALYVPPDALRPAGPRQVPHPTRL